MYGHVLKQGVSGKTIVWVLTVFCLQQVQTKCKFILKTVLCESINDAQRQCEIAEASRIVSVSISIQYSQTHCYKTKGGFLWGHHRANYGFSENIMWVKDGCRALFFVCYKPRVSTTPTTQSTPSRDIMIQSQMTSKHSGRKQTFETVLLSSESTTLCQMSSEPQTLSSQTGFRVSSTTVYTHVTTTKKTALKEHTYVSSLLLKTSTSTDESLTDEESTSLKASMTHRANTTDEPLVAIVVPIVIIVIGALAATIFLYKRRCSSDSKSKAIASKVDCNVSFHDKHGADCNVMTKHSTDLQSGYVYATVNRAHKQQILRPVACNKTISDSEMCYINTMIVDPEGGNLKIKDGDRLEQHSDVDDQIDSTGKVELNYKNNDSETTEGNEDYHSYFILERKKDLDALYREKTDIQMLPDDDEYNVIHKQSKEVLRDPNYDALEIQGLKIDNVSDDYSHLSQIQARVQDSGNYSHFKLKN